MPSLEFVVLENGRSHEIAMAAESAASDSKLRLATQPLLAALGWTQKPEGLCRGEVCIPLGGRRDLITPQGVDVLALAEALGRPVAIDREEAVASFGAETAAHGAQLTAGIAPDFTLPDLSGRKFSLSGFKGKKVLLIAYASW